MMNYNPEEMMVLQQPKENLGFFGFLIRFRLILSISLFSSTLTFLLMNYWIGITIFIVLMVTKMLAYKFIYKPHEKILNRKKTLFKEQRRHMTGL